MQRGAELRETYTANVEHATDVFKKAFPESTVASVAASRTSSGDFSARVNFGDYLKDCVVNIGSQDIQSCVGGIPAK